MQTEAGDWRAGNVLSTLGLGRSAEPTKKFRHQIRVIFSFQCIRRPGSAGDRRSKLDPQTMNNSSLNLRRLFSFPDPAAPATPPSNEWQEFQGRLGREVKTFKWPAAMPDLTSKIGELFNVELPDLFVSSWKKAREVREALDESSKSPEEVIILNLAEHEITNEFHPYIEIRIGGMPLPKKIEFKVQIVTALKGINLKIQAGKITEIQAGSCDFEGKVKYQDLALAEKKVGPIELLGISTIKKQEAAPAK